MTISLHPSTLPAVLSPVLTPFKEDGSPDVKKLLKQCQWLEANGVGQAIFGTNSEANSMSAPQKMGALTALIEGGLNPGHMMPGTGATSIDATVNMTRHAIQHRCAGVLMLPPFYYKDVTDDGLFAYFSEVIQKVGDAALQIYIYNIPPVTKINLSLSLLERLTKEYPKTVVGMKDSSGDWAYTESVIKLLTFPSFFTCNQRESSCYQHLLSSC
jgi:4-hydroxy-tetrahydrodipicolinate synthase